MHRSLTLVHDHIHRPRSLITVVDDIRARRAAETALLETSRREDHFLAILAHERRNPTALIRPGSVLLQR